VSTLKRISSRANPLVKLLRRVARGGSPRQRDGWVWLEGIHLCEEYLARIGQPHLAVFDARRLEPARGGVPTTWPDVRATEAVPAVESGSPVSEVVLQDLYRAIEPDRAVLLAGDVMEAVSEIAADQGVGFLVEQPGARLPSAIRQRCVLLDRIQDPGNVGSIIRTCAAAGIGTIILLEGSASAWSSKVLRAGQGAHFALDVYDQVSATEAAACLDVPVLATCLEDARSLYDAPLPAECAWVFGQEGQGVSRFWLERANERIHIPQAPGVESLNVGAAAAVCLFEQRRQMLARGVNAR